MLLFFVQIKTCVAKVVPFMVTMFIYCCGKYFMIHRTKKSCHWILFELMIPRTVYTSLVRGQYIRSCAMKIGEMVWARITEKSQGHAQLLALEHFSRPHFATVSVNICAMFYTMRTWKIFGDTFFILAKNDSFSAIFTKCKQKIPAILQFALLSQHPYLPMCTCKF